MLHQPPIAGVVDEVGGDGVAGQTHGQPRGARMGPQRNLVRGDTRLKSSMPRVDLWASVSANGAVMWMVV